MHARIVFQYFLRLESRVKRVNPSQNKIKMIIIIILKLDLIVNLGQGPGHGLGK